MKAATINFWRSQIIGLDQLIPTVHGNRPYINFDNAATTPPLKAVSQAIEELLPWYSSIHRGFGFKSQFSTDLYRQIRNYVIRFLGGDTKEYTAFFVKNTTEALNKLSYRLPRKAGSIILSTKMEHHSNDLPWRVRHRTEFVRVTKDGILDLEDLENKLRRKQVALVTLCGASNVTGLINPIYTIAEMAHYYGAQIAVDAAQLLPHHRVFLEKSGTYLDFLVFSGHKIYAPYGSGVLIGRPSIFLKGCPESLGGGTAITVSEKNFTLAPLPDREEAGTPNLIGAFALAKALKWLEENDFPLLSAYEEELTAYAFQELQKIPGLILYGPSPGAHRRVGVITFNITGLPHGLTAAALAYEGGIAVRHGCFCARPYVHHLLGLREEEILYYEALAKKGQKKDLPGMVRVSLAFFNTRQEIDWLMKTLLYIAENKDKIRTDYQINEETGEYSPLSGGETFTRKLQTLLEEHFHIEWRNA